jgi:GSCFA family
MIEAEPGLNAELGAAIVVGDEINDDFRYSERGTKVTARRKELIAPGASVFAIGSCFAQEIRRALNDNGFDARPRFEELEIDLDTQMAGPLQHINYYTTFSIRQELQRVLDQVPADPPHLPVAPGAWNVRFQGGWEALWQDPLRHGCVATTEAGILDVMAKTDAISLDALERADAFVFTLGIIESWVDTVTDLHVWSSKVRSVSPDPERFAFHLSTYEENLENLRWVCSTIGERFPGKPVVVSVSPVSMLNTYTDWDVVAANTYGKSMLRTVAGAIEVEFPHVTYWPSYELCTHADIYKPDGRHVRDDAVDHVVSQFLAAHAAGGGA